MSMAVLVESCPAVLSILQGAGVEARYTVYWDWVLVAESSLMPARPGIPISESGITGKALSYNKKYTIYPDHPLADCLSLPAA